MMFRIVFLFLFDPKRFLKASDGTPPFPSFSRSCFPRVFLKVPWLGLVPFELHFVAFGSPLTSFSFHILLFSGTPPSHPTFLSGPGTEPCHSQRRLINIYIYMYICIYILLDTADPTEENKKQGSFSERF